MSSSAKYEGCGEVGSIRAIFLAQFHTIQGPIIRLGRLAGFYCYLGLDRVWQCNEETTDDSKR